MSEIVGNKGSTAKLPPGVLHLMASAACDNQAFLYGDHVLGLQFHLEMDESGIAAMIGACSNELAEGPYVQPADEMLDKAKKMISGRALYCLLDNWIFTL